MAKKKLNDTYANQINVLRILCQEGAISQECRVAADQRSTIERSAEEPKQYQISEITELSGLTDERETQRYLFILEGQKLVSPFPAGDFTSKTWIITKHGQKTLRSIRRSLAA